jgi:formylglycine-generating enzyme
MALLDQTAILSTVLGQKASGPRYVSRCCSATPKAYRVRPGNLDGQQERLSTLDATQANLTTMHPNGEPRSALPADFPAFWACDWGEDGYGLWMAFRYRGIRQQLRWIMPGEFIMGSPESETEHNDDATPHRVILSHGFWLADTACTQALWQGVMGENPSRFQGEERPVEQVSWDDVQDFIERLNTVVPGGGFRLPTEAEWEYACRAGTTTAFWFGDQITPEQVNYDGNYPYAGGRKGLYRKETVAVKALPCNGWGLYQMHGNVWEWCQDWYGRYPEGTVVDPSGPPRGGLRVLRGGSWINDGRFARSAIRVRDEPGLRYDYFGFRLARGQATSEPAEAETRAASAGQT